MPGSAECGEPSVACRPRLGEAFQWQDCEVATTQVELEPIDRLEEKVKLLVGMIDRLRAEQRRAGGRERAAVARARRGAKARLAEAEGASAELAALREERDLIRSRVDEMLQQIES